MPSLSDFGLGPEAPESERRRARRYTDDESGARPLPSDAYYASDPLDERVELPGVWRSDAALFFGIGAGLGVAVLAIGGALYFGGYLDRPALGPAPATTGLVPELRLAPLEEVTNADALAFARVAAAKLSAPPVFATPPPVESPDITVTEEPTAPPADSSAPRSTRRPNSLSEELEALDRAQPTPMPTPREPPLPPPAQPTAPAETAPPGETLPPQNPY